MKRPRHLPLPECYHPRVACKWASEPDLAWAYDLLNFSNILFEGVGVRALTLLVCFSLFLGLAACADKKTGVDENPVQPVVETVSCVAVLPTVAASDGEGAVSAQTSAALADGAAHVDRVLAKELGSNSKFHILRSTSALAAGSSEDLQQIGKESGCNAVMSTNLYRFQQRQGGEMAADAPASASLAMRIVKIDTGKVIWASEFDETQESLLSNLLSFGKAQSRGFKWITVEELVEQGVRGQLAKCPYR